MNRIRYIKTAHPDVLKSARALSNAARREFGCYLNISALTWQITELPTNASIVSGASTSVHKAKIAAKKALEDLGVVFEKENREHFVLEDLE